jgi:hypothetical protein
MVSIPVSGQRAKFGISNTELNYKRKKNLKSDRNIIIDVENQITKGKQTEDKKMVK